MFVRGETGASGHAGFNRVESPIYFFYTLFKTLIFENWTIQTTILTYKTQ